MMNGVHAQSKKNAVRKHDLVWAVPEVTPDVSPKEAKQRRIRAVAQQLVDLIGENKIKVPMLPQAATEAMRLANDPSACIRDIETVVTGDPILAARVLAVANSPLYGGHHVRSLGRALQRLGTGTIRDILYQAVAEAHIFRGNAGQALQMERQHAVSVAHATRLVCQYIGLESGYAFVCGLLHDIGRPVLMEVFQSTQHKLPEDEQESVTQHIHAYFGAHLAASWGLPKLVLEACRRHHVYRNWGGKENYSQIGNVVAVADRLAIHFGIGRETKPVDLERDRTYFDLGLDVSLIPQLLEKLQGVATMSA